MKLIAGAIATAVLVGTGLSLATAPANADTRYPGSVKTKCSVSVAKKGSTVTIKSLVKANGKGTVKSVRVVKVLNAKGKVVKRVKISGSKSSAKIKLPKKGKYTLKVTGAPTQKVYKNCTTSKKFRR